MIRIRFNFLWRGANFCFAHSANLSCYGPVGGPHSKGVMLCGPQLNGKKLLRAEKKFKKLSNNAKIDKYSQFSKVLRCARAAQTHLGGHMRPAGRVFETPDLYVPVKMAIYFTGKNCSSVIHRYIYLYLVNRQNCSAKVINIDLSQ